MAHLEDAVIGEIDALIDEQLAGGPGDDYGVNRFPQCDCGHDWHGTGCAACDCPGVYATDEECNMFRRPQQRRARRNIDFRIDCGIEDCDRCGYTPPAPTLQSMLTLADLHALQSRLIRGWCAGRVSAR